MRQREGRPRVLWIAEIPTPYNLPTLSALSELVDLTVVFGARRGSHGMDWAFGTPPFRHHYAEGFTLRRSRANGTDIYLTRGCSG